MYHWLVWQIWLELAVISAVVLLWAAFGLPRPAVVRAAGNRFARDYLLWIAPSDVDGLDRAHRTDYWLHGLAMAVGLLAYLGARLVASPYVVALVALSAAAALSALLRLVQAGRDFPHHPGAAAIARIRVVRLRDYLPVQTIVILACCPAIAAAGVVVGLVAIGRGMHNIERAWFVVVSGTAVCVLGVLMPVIAAAMTRRPQPASDSGHLYLQDAWRVERLREMLWSECMGVVTVFTQAHLLLAETGDSSLWALPLVLLPPAVMLIFASGRLHFRRRLWPDLAQGEKVVVGTTEPVA